MGDLGRRLAQALAAKQQTNTDVAAAEDLRRRKERDTCQWNAYALFDLLTPHAENFNASTEEGQHLRIDVDNEIVCIDQGAKHLLRLEFKPQSVWIIRPSGAWTAKDVWLLMDLSEGCERFTNSDYAARPSMNGEQFCELCLSIALGLHK